MSKQQLSKDVLIVALFVIAAALVYLTFPRATNHQNLGQTETLSNSANNAPTMQAQQNGQAQVKIETLKEGTGPAAQSGQTVAVHYVGTLENGTEFDSSLKRGQPIELKLGAGQVIPGWEIGILGMKVGEKRRLTIPPGLAYGANGIPGVIPQNATLIFEVELMGLK